MTANPHAGRSVDWILFHLREWHAHAERSDYLSSGGERLEQATATFHRFVCYGEETMLLYSYAVGDAQYCFLCSTPFDEIHRRHDPTHEEWYDQIKDGDEFAVAYRPKAPEKHAVTDAVFSQMPKMSAAHYFIGTRAKPVGPSA